MTIIISSPDFWINQLVFQLLNQTKRPGKSFQMKLLFFADVKLTNTFNPPEKWIAFYETEKLLSNKFKLVNWSIWKDKDIIIRPARTCFIPYTIILWWCCGVQLSPIYNFIFIYWHAIVSTKSVVKQLSNSLVLSAWWFSDYEMKKI